MWSTRNTYYVSRFTGKDSTTCGTPLLPCRTINYGLHEVFDGLLVYLDGTETEKDPYNCQSLNNSQSGIYLTKSVSFVGVKSRAYISCLHGNEWLADGVNHRHGLNVTFSRLSFSNTSLRLLDASVYINDTLFTDSRHPAIDFTAVNLIIVSLSLNNVVFQQNIVCISVEGNNKIDIFLRLKDSTFIQNGNCSFDLASVLWLGSEKSDVVIQFRNCNFERNNVNKYGIVFIHNKQGLTDFSIRQFKLEDSGQRSEFHRDPKGLIISQSAQTIMTLEFGSVYRTYGTLLTVNGQSSKINMLDTTMNEFYGSSTGSGAINITNKVSGCLLIQNSFLRSGKSLWYGGVVFMTAPKVNLTIWNSTFENISTVFENISTGYGGVLFFDSYDIYIKSYTTKNYVAELNIDNSSFIDNVGGVLYGRADYVIANITHCLFQRNTAQQIAAALLLIAQTTAEISLDNVIFMENRAGFGGIVQVTSTSTGSSEGSRSFFAINNVWFVKNNANGQDVTDLQCILNLFVTTNMSSLVFKNSYFIDNIAVKASVLCRLTSKNRKNAFHSVTIDKCTFKKNVAEFGVLRAAGFATMFCKQSLFDSNIYIPCRGPAFGILMANSEVKIANSKFVNNSCGAIYPEGNKASYLKIDNTIFLRNQRMGGSGGAMILSITADGKNKDQNHKRRAILRNNNVYLQNVLFKENMAADAAVLSIVNGKMGMSNCVFLNNFAHFQGGQIATYGSNELKISDCVFNETVREKIIRNGTKFSASGFLRVHGSGMLQLENTTFISNVPSNDPIVLVARSKGIIIDNSTTTICPLGSGVKKSINYYRDSNDQLVTVLDMSCRKCRYNFYSLQRGRADGLYLRKQSFVCFPCPRGADCFPAVKAKNNFWGYAVNLNTELAFTICPFGYCKSPKPRSSNYNECEGQRTGIMCGMCLIGYTETLLSTHCAPNNSCKENWFWVVFLLLVSVMAVLLVYKPPIIAYSLKQLLYFKRLTNRRGCERHEIISCASSHEESTHEIRLRSSVEQQKHDKRQFSRYLEVVFYFYQIAQLLLSSYSVSEFFGSRYLPPVLNFFNFQPSYNKRGAICPFPGLTPKTKLLFKVVPIFGTLVAIFVLYLFNLVINKFRGTFPHSSSSYLQASIKTLFLGYVTLAVVSISLVRCVSVGGETRWFYNGNVICYQWWQYCSFAFIGSFAIPFIFVLFWTSFAMQYGKITVKQFLLVIVFPLPVLVLWLFRRPFLFGEMTVQDNQNLIALKEMLLGPYRKAEENQSKYGAVYWQSVLIARRFILVAIYCVVTEPSARLFCMTLVCVLVLVGHLIVKPFRNSFANNSESISLLLLVILGLINLCKSMFVGLEGNIKGSLITLFTVFQWTEFVILGIFPTLLSIMICLAVLSLVVRILFICLRFVFKGIFRRSIRMWDTDDRGRLINICEERHD